MFCAVLMAAFQHSNVGVDLCFHIYVTLFSLRRRHGFKIHGVTERDIYFPNDCQLIASTETEIQRSMDLFANDSTNEIFCLKVVYFSKATTVLFNGISLLRTSSSLDHTDTNE